MKLVHLNKIYITWRRCEWKLFNVVVVSFSTNNINQKFICESYTSFIRSRFKHGIDEKFTVEIITNDLQHILTHITKFDVR